MLHYQILFITMPLKIQKKSMKTKKIRCQDQCDI